PLFRHQTTSSRRGATMTMSLRLSSLIVLTIAFVLAGDVGIAAAQGSGATVQRTQIEDTFFNQCTGEVVDRSYTRHVTRRKSGDDYIYRVHWSNGKGVGRDTGDKYTMQWTYHQTGQHADDPDSEQGVHSYRIKTKVQSPGPASDYSSDIVVRLRITPDGTVVVDQSEATGVQCS
ncbi:MAG: hypothetical protein ACODAA_02765, partial [Gemmatimonadota bacterium]